LKSILLTIIFIIFLLEIISYYLKANNIFLKFEKYKLNPVLGNIKTGIVFDPHVMEDKNGFYRMYVSLRKFGKIAMSLS